MRERSASVIELSAISAERMASVWMVVRPAAVMAIAIELAFETVERRFTWSAGGGRQPPHA